MHAWTVFKMSQCRAAAFSVYQPKTDNERGDMKRAQKHGISYMDAQARALGLPLVPRKGRNHVEATILGKYGITAAQLPQNQAVGQDDKLILQAIYDQVCISTTALKKYLLSCICATFPPLLWNASI